MKETPRDGHDMPDLDRLIEEIGADANGNDEKSRVLQLPGTDRVIARGPRQEFEMEQALPGWNPADYDPDPITDSNELKEAGDFAGARKLLMELCQADLRCLDAHAHLGNLVFDRMLWLNPSDNQGVRFVIGEVRSKTPWVDR